VTTALRYESRQPERVVTSGSYKPIHVIGRPREVFSQRRARDGRNELLSAPWIAEERILRIRKDPDLVSLSLVEERRGEYRWAERPRYKRGAGESSSEREMHGSERAALIRLRMQANERERACELYWERLDAVWPSVTTRLRRSPERWPFGSLKGLRPPRSPIESPPRASSPSRLRARIQRALSADLVEKRAREAPILDFTWISTRNSRRLFMDLRSVRRRKSLAAFSERNLTRETAIVFRVWLGAHWR